MVSDSSSRIDYIVTRSKSRTINMEEGNRNTYLRVFCMHNLYFFRPGFQSLILIFRYLPVDMQFHVFLLPVVVIAVVRWPRVGAIVAFLAFFIPAIGQYVVEYCRMVRNFSVPSCTSLIFHNIFFFGFCFFLPFSRLFHSLPLA